MHRIVVLLVVLAACFGKKNDVTGALTTGAVTTPMRESHVIDRGAAAKTATERDHVSGVEVRSYVATPIDDVAIPNTYGIAVRQLGEGAGVQTSIQAGYLLTHQIGRATVFGRLMMDLLSVTEIGYERYTLSGLSPTADFGIAPFGHGLCVTFSGTWDVKFDEPDRALLGLFIGICGGPLKH
ncbi:MAG: hypothetical protein ABI867_21935 [Kofleriaceae bacterium]